MLGLSFGHTSLVTRLTLLRFVKACKFADQACEVEGCVGKRCMGNKMEEVPNPSFSPSSQSSGSSSNFHPTIELVQAMLCPPQKWQHGGARL